MGEERCLGNRANGEVRGLHTSLGPAKKKAAGATGVGHWELILSLARYDSSLCAELLPTSKLERVIFIPRPSPNVSGYNTWLLHCKRTLFSGSDSVSIDTAHAALNLRLQTIPTQLSSRPAIRPEFETSLKPMRRKSPLGWPRRVAEKVAR